MVLNDRADAKKKKKITKLYLGHDHKMIPQHLSAYLNPVLLGPRSLLGGKFTLSLMIVSHKVNKK